jgi:hypothetical protein
VTEADEWYKTLMAIDIRPLLTEVAQELEYREKYGYFQQLTYHPPKETPWTSNPKPNSKM